MIMGYQKDTAGMRSSDYPKERKRERSIGAGRHFKLDVKNRFLMLLAYYRLYITYTLAGFLFDLDQSSICRDIQKIEPLVRECVPIPQKMHKTTKRLRTPEEVEKHFPGFMAFIDCTEQQIPRPENRRKKEDVLFRQEEKAHRKDTAHGQQPGPHHSQNRPQERTQA